MAAGCHLLEYLNLFQCCCLISFGEALLNGCPLLKWLVLGNFFFFF